MVAMNYAQAIAHLHALGPELAPPAGGGAPRRKFDLAHMRRLCAELGNPQDKVPAVLIAGTNGKGSTAATLASILTAAGYRTGLYTSPHLTRVNERIQLAHATLPSEYGAEEVHGGDGPLQLTPIADDDFARVYTLVDEAAVRLVNDGQLPHPPSFFERLTAVAFTFYAGLDRAGKEGAGTDRASTKPRAEIVVLEVGLGGRLDATNVVEPLLSVITDIALDHQEYLGNTIAEIAAEKCGILRENGILITLSQHPEANQAIGEAAARLKVRGVNAATFLPPARRNSAEPPNAAVWRNRYALPVENVGLLTIDSPLAGDHQQRNLALALAAATELRDRFGYRINVEALEQGVRGTKWPGRLEWLTPQLLLDVAHNPAGAWTLRSAIATLPETQPRTLLFSCLRDKDLREMARILFPLFDSSHGGDPARQRDHLVLAPIPNRRAASLEDLVAVAAELGIPAQAAADPAAALRLAQNLTPADGVIVATGSVYLVGELRALALEAAEVLV
jgi:dihydrofolate synthase/folylpolyglutamate synthase